MSRFFKFYPNFSSFTQIFPVLPRLFQFNPDFSCFIQIFQVLLRFVYSCSFVPETCSKNEPNWCKITHCVALYGKVCESTPDVACFFSVKSILECNQWYFCREETFSVLTKHGKKWQELPRHQKLFGCNFPNCAKITSCNRKSTLRKTSL